jgi:hypothetical protein
LQRVKDTIVPEDIEHLGKCLRPAMDGGKDVQGLEEVGEHVELRLLASCVEDLKFDLLLFLLLLAIFC